MMERRTPTVSELVRHAVAICDPGENDDDLARFEEQLEDDDEPITAVENLEERLALAIEGADYELENPAVAVAGAIVLYLARSPSHGDEAHAPEELIRRAARAQWHRDPPQAVVAWLDARGARDT